jgi:hypothetical protein
MGFDTFPIIDQASHIDQVSVMDENSEISRSKVARLERNEFRRFSIRNSHSCHANAKKDDDDRKPAAKVLPSTRSRNGIKIPVS